MQLQLNVNDFKASIFLELLDEANDKKQAILRKYL